MNIYKIKPTFYQDILDSDEANPVFLAYDYKCCNYIRNELNGLCMLCTQPVSRYDFSACKDKEIWIAKHDNTSNSILEKLAYAILPYGAREVKIIPFTIDKVQTND